MRAIEELDTVLCQWDANAKARYLAQFAVEELGTNIIKYGYDAPGEHFITLSAAPEHDRIRITLEDDGHEFDPCRTPDPDPDLSLEDRAPGGWGLCLVRQLLAGMSYQRCEGRNLVSVWVSKNAQAAPGD